jgi:hypothetical protein
MFLVNHTKITEWVRLHYVFVILRIFLEMLRIGPAPRIRVGHACLVSRDS